MWNWKYHTKLIYLSKDVSSREYVILVRLFITTLNTSSLFGRYVGGTRCKFNTFSTWSVNLFFDIQLIIITNGLLMLYILDIRYYVSNTTINIMIYRHLPAPIIACNIFLRFVAIFKPYVPKLSLIDRFLITCLIKRIVNAERIAK